MIGYSEERGWNVTVRDLYAIGFNPVLSASDLAMLHRGETPAEIEKEQRYLKQADVVTFLYPMWWSGFPAILKGYIDRVMAYGFAYKAENGGIKGLLTDKKVLLFTTMGNSLSSYEEKNLLTAFRLISKNEIFGFCGMEVVHHQFFEKITSADEALVECYISESLDHYTNICVKESISVLAE